MNYETKAVHGGRKDKTGFEGPSYPVYLSSTFIQESLNDFGEFVYTRSANPTRDNLEKQVAQLEGSKYALATATGMAATALSLSILEPGDKVLLNNNVYGGTWGLVNEFLSEKGITYEVVDDFNTYDFSQTPEDVKAIFLETPSNPLLYVTDLENVIKDAKEKDLSVIVDNTFMTSYLQKPHEFGADVVVYSATKYYGGHSDVMAGLLTVNDDELYERLKLTRKFLGSPLSAFDSFLLNRGIKTLHVRYDRQLENTQKVAEYLDQHDGVDKTYYPGLENSQGYEIQKRIAKGAGAVLSIELSDKYDLDLFTRSLEIFDLAVSLGGVESLICLPALMTHETYSTDLQADIGIKPNLLRIAVGVENADDLIQDLEQAFEKSRK